jgi:hypothetical protein
MERYSTELSGFDVEFNLPCKVEIKLGPHWGATQEVNLKDYENAN